MPQSISRFEEVIVRHGNLLPMNDGTAPVLKQHETRKRIAAGGSQFEGTDVSVQFDDPRRLRVPYKPLLFVDQRCPICGSFGCGGC